MTRVEGQLCSHHLLRSLHSARRVPPGCAGLWRDGCDVSLARASTHVICKRFVYTRLPSPPARPEIFNNLRIESHGYRELVYGALRATSSHGLELPELLSAQLKSIRVPGNTRTDGTVFTRCGFYELGLLHMHLLHEYWP